ncbi:MAG: glycosyltransferase family 4 protein, partial [Bacteroidota bacterium]|nr:glycosyltransferase family 4 protein [Bacteroidota bacterium]
HNFWTNRIDEFVSDFKIDTLHVHDLYMAKSGGAVKQKHDIKLVVDLHENYPAAVYGYKWAVKFPNCLFTMPWKWASFEKKYLKYADKIVVLSENFKKSLAEKYSYLKENQFAIYSNVPDIDRLLSYPIDKNILPKKKDEKIIFYFGFIAARRGVFTAFEALRLLLKRGVKVRLVVIGPVDKAEKSRFDKYLNDAELKQSITFFSWKDLSDLPSLVVASDVCVSPIVKNAQHESGVANKVFQYMLFERPIVVSDCKPQVDVVNEANCGAVFESENIVNLADVLQKIISNPEESKKMGERGRKLIFEKYNLKLMGQNLVEMYSSLS